MGPYTLRLGTLRTLFVIFDVVLSTPKERNADMSEPWPMCLCTTVKLLINAECQLNAGSRINAGLLPQRRVVSTSHYITHRYVIIDSRKMADDEIAYQVDINAEN